MKNDPSLKKDASAQPAHRFDATMFREYDIRGIAGQSLRVEDAYTIGRAFGTTVASYDEGGTVCVGRDGRMSSPEFADALIQGVRDCGINVVDIGLGPTPMLYYASKSLDATGGVMITGSHNPKDHNGFKFVLNNGPFFGQDIQGLRAIGESGQFAKGQGNLSTRDIRDEYLKVLLSAYDGERNLRVAWDAGNGATGEIMQGLANNLPGEHTVFFAEIDGDFPNHHPDPTEPHNLVDIIGAVRSKGLDLGVAFDGDGDRVGVVDDEGEILWGDQLMMLYAADVLRERPGATIIADVKASGALFEEIARLGGNPLMWKTGHSLIKSKMAETKAPLAGEMSGHIFFADKYYGYDDGLYAAIRLLSLLSRQDRKLSDLRKALPKRINTPEMRFPCADLRKFDVISEVKNRLKLAGADVSDVDGVRVNTADGWWLLRASNTQPVLVARCEAKDDAGLVRLREALKDQLAQSDVQLPD
ncbi:MAG: phosphomannomutase/phosphoglucomutase [Rickettsiales bacterium]|nr:phosphomannomutase/phosphoglucomutase [Rickettsiales bacterium]